MSSKRVFIVHCWEGYPDYCWYPSVKEELETQGFDVNVSEFPETDFPKQEAWVPFLSKLVGKPNEDTYLIGHSIGVATILRYLESLPAGEKIGGAVLVAGFIDDLGLKEISNFFTTPINLEKIKERSNNFTAIHSTDDPYVPLKHGDVFERELGAKLIVKEKMGHFSGPVDDKKSCLALPEVTSSILEQSESNAAYS